MQNIFINISNADLYKIYEDYLITKKEGSIIHSFIPYALKIKEMYSLKIELANCIKIVEKMFFEEVARRFFTLTANKQ